MTGGNTSAPLLGPARLAGVVLLAICVVMYDPTAQSFLHRLLIPLLLALSAWMLTRNLAVVLLGVAVLAAIHSNPSGGDWASGFIYPLIATVAGVVVLGIGIGRFRRRIITTREARWASRR